MSGRALDDAERAAGAIVAGQLGGLAIEQDGEHGSHDFDVRLADGQTVALEVTAAADEGIEAQRVELGRVREVPTLRSHWNLVFPFDSSINMSKALADAVEHIEVLERHGVSEVGGLAKHGPPLDGEVAEAARALRQLRVTTARVWSAPAPGEVARLLPSLGGGASSNFDRLNELVARCAARKVAKLIAAERDDRHLFVWMRGSVSDAELAMATLPPPPTVPDLPTGIDVVWVATGGVSDEPCGKLWRLQPPGGWEQILP